MGHWQFRPLRPDDLVRLHRWLNQPHVACWWGGSIEAAAVAAKYRPRIARPAAVAPYLALLDHRPLGYLQINRQDLLPGVGLGIDPGTVGLDAFLGEVESLGRGLGSAMIGAFVRTIVFADPAVTGCIVDPDPANTRAVRAFARAGFRPLDVPPWMALSRDQAATTVP